MAELFNALTGAARSEYRKAIVAPDHMRKWFLREVERTIEAHRNGRGPDRAQDELARRRALHPRASTLRRRPACGLT